MRTLIIATLMLAAPLAGAQTPAAAPERTASPAGAEVYIISPRDGATVHSPVRVQFGLKGMGVAPARVKLKTPGHPPLLIDGDAPADAAAPLPATDKI